jgi:hypothetical protein
MTTPTPHAIAAAIVLALLLAASHLLDGPSDVQAAQDTADAHSDMVSQARSEAAPGSTRSRITTLNHHPHLPAQEATP